MGSWGYKSYSNDATMDFLDDLNKKSALAVLNKVWREFDEPIEKLGVVIFLLEKRKEYQIPMTKLKEALIIAKAEIEDVNNLQDWKRADERKKAVKKEIELLKKEITNRRKTNVAIKT